MNSWRQNKYFIEVLVEFHWDIYFRLQFYFELSGMDLDLVISLKIFVL